MIKKKKLIITIIVIIMAFYACSKDDGFSLPAIKTLDASVYSEGGVKLNGDIIRRGSEKVVDYGFEVSGRKYHGELPVPKGKFSIDIKQGLYPEQEYFFVAYIKTETETYRGEELSFFSRGSVSPILEKCIPSLTHINDTIILQGKNFPENNTNNTQLKYGKSSAKIISISETEIKFVVPKPTIGNNIIEITAFDKTIQKGDLLNLHKPLISSITPSTAFFGDTIVINGDHLANNINYSSVLIGGYNAKIVSTSRNMTKVVVPLDVNYSDTRIRLTAQNQNVDYSNFSLRVPQFTYVPEMIYTGEYIEIKVDKTSSIQKNLLINDIALNPTVIDDTTFRFWLNNGIVLEDRKNELIWRINDLDIVSEVQLNIVNPFIKIKDGYYNFWPFDEIEEVFTIDDKVYVIANKKTIYGDERRFFYLFDEINIKWIEQVYIDTNTNSDIQAFGPYSSELTSVYSPHDKEIYFLHKSQYENNFFKVAIDSGIITTLPSNHASSVYGIGFAYEDKVYYNTATGDAVWQFDISSNNWSLVTNTPFAKGGFRNIFVNVIVVDNYAYFANGETGSNYADFWRLNLDNLNWEQLTDNPNPKKYSTVYHFNDELHFVSGEANKYNLNSGSWETIDKAGVKFGNNEPIFSFTQNGTPYLIRKNVFSNITYLNLYIGDLIK